MENVKAIGCIKVLEEKLGKDYDLFEVTYEEETQILKEYAEKHNYLIYSRCKDEFSRYEAVHMAIDGGFNGAILENLS